MVGGLAGELGWGWWQGGGLRTGYSSGTWLFLEMQSAHARSLDTCEKGGSEWKKALQHGVAISACKKQVLHAMRFPSAKVRAILKQWSLRPLLCFLACMCFFCLICVLHSPILQKRRPYKGWGNKALQGLVGANKDIMALL